jgi:hypothetical protein
MLRNKLFQPWFVGEKDWGFEIVEGPFKEVCIQIENLEFKDEDTGNCTLDYHTVRLPEHLKPESLQTPEFEEVINQIINDILTEAIKEYETRNSDTQKPDTP